MVKAATHPLAPSLYVQLECKLHELDYREGDECQEKQLALFPIAPLILVGVVAERIGKRARGMGRLIFKTGSH